MKQKNLLYRYLHNLFGGFNEEKHTDPSYTQGIHKIP